MNEEHTNFLWTQQSTTSEDSEVKAPKPTTNENHPPAGGFSSATKYNALVAQHLAMTFTRTPVSLELKSTLQTNSSVKIQAKQY
jgi:hypothetical protein